MKFNIAKLSFMKNLLAVHATCMKTLPLLIKNPVKILPTSVCENLIEFMTTLAACSSNNFDIYFDTSSALVKLIISSETLIRAEFIASSILLSFSRNILTADLH